MKFSRHYLMLFFSFCLVFSLADKALADDIKLSAHNDGLYSEVIYQESDFNTIALRFESEVDGLMMNAHPSLSNTWQPIEVHDDGFGAEALVFTPLTNQIQFKLNTVAQKPFNFSAEFLNFSANDSNELLYSGPQVAATGSTNVISRSSWGADESLRYWTPELEEIYKNAGSNNNADACADLKKAYPDEVAIKKTVKFDAAGEFIWPLYYTDRIEKIVVHHTDSEIRDLNGDARMDSRDYKAMMRAIYYYHTVSRGWGDIGYNYVIDPLGNVYEGRTGGDKVIAAHALCHNNGSLGIALIGNYENNEVPEPARLALIQLIAEKSKLHGIDPKSSSVFRGKNLPNIIGHRDVRATSCPGKNLYELLPRIRERVALAIKSGSFNENQISVETLDYNASFLDKAPYISFNPNQTKKITLTFQNTGKKTWDQNTWLHVALNKTSGSRVLPVVQDKNFVAADMKESSVSPGQKAHFEVELQAGYYGGVSSFELSPVVNGQYKISRASTFATLNVADPNLSYELLSSELPAGDFFQGEQIQASIRLKNTGNVAWVNFGETPIRLGTEATRDRKSKLTQSSRLAHLIETRVDPGEVGTFALDLKVPDNFEGKINERFSPVIENVSWLQDKRMGFSIQVKKPRHLARISGKTKIDSLMPGERARIELKLNNRGDLDWNENNMRINLIPSGLELFKKVLRPAEIVKKGKDYQFSFWIQAPYEAGDHRVSFTSRFNNKRISGGSSRFLINVPEPRLHARRVNQSDSSVTLRPNQEQVLEVQFKNLGNVVWQQKGVNAIYLAPSEPQDRKSRLYYEEEWFTRFRAAEMLEEEVKPGEVGTFRLKIKPTNQGFYRENFQLVIERVGWLENSLVRWDIRVSGEPVSSSSTINTKPSTQLTDNQKKAAQAIENRTRSIDDSAEPAFSSTTDIVDSSVVKSSTVESLVIPEPQLDEKPFRVLIDYKADDSDLTVNEPFLVSDGNQIIANGSANQKVSIRRVGSRFRLIVGNFNQMVDQVRLIPKNQGVVEILTMERRPTWNLNLNDNRFRGTMEIRSIDGQTHFINELPLEDYMKGLAEVSNGTPVEKQKTIAILARSYARFYMQGDQRKFPRLPYDGSDDPDVFQRYLGYGVETRSPQFVAAVEATKDEVVTYQGKLIKTPYFSQSDGRTRSAKEVWGWDNTPYLQSVEDPYCQGLVLRGHGVGLSGCGSEGMAKAGKTFEEIIKYYYQGVQIETISN